MCGRFAIATSKQQMIEYLQEHFDIYDEDLTYKLPGYNIAPGVEIPVITAEHERCCFSLAAWGFIPSFIPKGGKAFRIINAKAETLHEKPMFKQALENNRCLIPLSGFYEWKAVQNKKIPYYAYIRDEPIFAVAGIINFHNGRPSCAIITTAANDILKPIHERMPVIVARGDYRKWLDNRPFRQGLLQPDKNNVLTVSRVSDCVNKTTNDTAECIKPIS